MLSGNTPLLPSSNSNKLQPARLLENKYEEDYAKPYQRPRELLDYFSLVLKRKWLIMSLVLVGTTLAVLYLAQQPAIYEATSVIRIEQQSNNFLQTKEVFYSYRSPEYWNTQLSRTESHGCFRSRHARSPNNRSFLTEPKERGIVAALRRIREREKDRSNTADPSTRRRGNVPP